MFLRRSDMPGVGGQAGFYKEYIVPAAAMMGFTPCVDRLVRQTDLPHGFIERPE